MDCVNVDTLVAMQALYNVTIGGHSVKDRRFRYCVSQLRVHLQLS